MRLFTAHDYKHIPWPKTTDGQYAKLYWTPLLKNGVQQYINNIDAEIYILVTDTTVLPVTVGSSNLNDSYVNSAYSHFISYSKDELRHLPSLLIIILLRTLLTILQILFRFGRVNRVIYVNNWFLSTNLYPQINDDCIANIAHFLSKRFPDHSIIFRSLNHRSHKHITDSLQQSDFLPVISRQVYHFTPALLNQPNSNRKKDDKLLTQSGFQITSPPYASYDDLA